VRNQFANKWRSVRGHGAVAVSEHLELARGKREQFAIRLAGPPHLWSGPHVMADQLAF
jgi:hypothetical protein